jgi:DNA-binding MarR family transcriptional regulator
MTMNIALSQPEPISIESVDPLCLDNQLCFALYAASHAIKKIYRPLLDELGLTYPQYLILMVLWTENSLKVSDIGQRLHLDSGTLTPVLKRLETTGLVKRARRLQDEREVEISLTQDGHALRAKALGVSRDVAALLKMSESKAASLRDELKSLVASLNIDD